MDLSYTILQKDIKNKLARALKGVDLLLIVPPAATTKSPILGPLILSGLAKEHGFSAQVLHLNLLLASIIGVELYESISFSQPFRLLGERLFARAAHGLPPLGLVPESCYEPIDSVYGKGHRYPLEAFEYKYHPQKEFDLKVFFEVEKVCFSLIEIVTRYIASMDYKIVGCSSNWEQNNCSAALLGGVKKHAPHTVTIIGGCNCEAEMAAGVASLSSGIDYVFSGEGEEVFAEFLENVKQGNFPAERIIRGRPVKDLNAIPQPDFESFVNQQEIFFTSGAPGKWTLVYETSRGCFWGKCDFCGLNGEGRAVFRKKAADKVADELEDLHRLYPDKMLGMTDKVMPPVYQKTLVPQLQQRSVPRLSYEQRSDMTLIELIDLKKAGFVSIKPGIEALSGGLLRLMNKGITLADNLLLLRHCACLGLYVDWNLLWAFPGDKKSFYEETLVVIPLLRHLCPPAVFRHISLDRFSPYFQKPQNFGITNLRPWAVYHSVYPEQSDLDQTAYRFIGDYESEAMENPDLIQKIAGELGKWKQKWRSAKLIMQRIMGLCMIIDTRESEDNPATYIMDEEKAREVMVPGEYSDSENQQWAVEHKLAVAAEGVYVPLVLAAPDLLLHFGVK